VSKVTTQHIRDHYTGQFNSRGICQYGLGPRR